MVQRHEAPHHRNAPDDAVIGGGNVIKLEVLPTHSSQGENANTSGSVVENSVGVPDMPRARSERRP
jgi:hypothetical protein